MHKRNVQSIGVKSSHVTEMLQVSLWDKCLLGHFRLRPLPGTLRGLGNKATSIVWLPCSHTRANSG